MELRCVSLLFRVYADIVKMAIIARLGFEPNPDLPKSPPRPSPTPSPTPTPIDVITSITSSMATPSPTSTDTGGGFLHVAEDGTSGDKILRGFLIGVAIGIALSIFLCCWLPCCRKRRRSRLQRRNDNIRRRLVILEDETWVHQNWPQRRPWDVGQDERNSNESQSHESISHVSHEEA